MQQLYLHPTWEKAVSNKDRLLIEQVFEETFERTEDIIMSPIIRTSFNYKNELLVTALVHNFTHHSTRFKNRSVAIHAGDFYYEKTFTIPELTIAPFTSMPWTFIFEPVEGFESISLNDVIIEID